MANTFKFKLFSLLALCILTAAVVAEEAVLSNTFSAEKALRELKQLQLRLGEGSLEAELEMAIQRFSGLQKKASDCVARETGRLKELAQPLEVLGEAAEGDSPEIVQQRRILQKNKSDAENRLSECRLLVISIQAATEEWLAIIQKQRASKLFSQRMPIWDMLASVQELKQWSFDAKAFKARSGVSLLTFDRLAVFLLLLVFSVAFSYGLKRHWRPTIAQYSERAFSDKLAFATASSIVRFSFSLLMFGSFSVYFFTLSFSDTSIPFLATLCYGAFVYTLLLCVVYVLLIPVNNEASPLVALPADETAMMAKRMNSMSFLLFICYLAYMVLLSQSFSVVVITVMRDILITILCLILITLLWLVSRLSVVKQTARLLRAVFIALLLGVIGAEWLGFRNFAAYLLFNVAITAATLLVFWLTTNLMQDFFQGLAEGQRAWQQKLRNKLGLKANEKELGIYWLHIALVLVLWVILILWLLRVWGVPSVYFNALYEYTFSGFAIGEYHFVPSYMIYAIIIFSLLLIVFRWFRDQVVTRSLVRTGVERGAREAIVSISGYIGFVIALIVALAVAGVDFSSLAIIAGALSLGIGFGLQNVVNNFVSGLILLFERPIKTGDWIVVGQTEGYVKKISIRSTIIQTFDRSDVIVPNSDLISSQVTNWMFREHYGRIKVPVGVAYGSDTEKVKSILLAIANEHPEAITSGFVPKPDVLFMGFGESSLDFELRCVVYDIDKRRQIISEINFAIDKAFRENNIEIPFPQRDVHIKRQKKSQGKGEP